LTFKSAGRTLQMGIPERWAEGLLTDSDPSTVTSLRAGAQLKYQFFMHETSGGTLDGRTPGQRTPDFLFNQAEQFEVSVDLMSEGVPVNTSNKVTLTVNNPSPADLPVLAALNALPPGSKLGIGSWVRPTGLTDAAGAADLRTASGPDAATMRDLLNANPSSVYAPYLRFHLAMLDFKTSVVSDPLDVTRQAVIIDAPAYTRAVQSFDVLAKAGDSILAPQALGQLAIQFRMTDRALQRDGQRAFDTLRRKHDSTDYFLGEWAAVTGNSLKE
jgi:hypothetical protein